MSHPLADAIRERVDAVAAASEPRVGVVDGTSPLTISLGGTSGIEVSKAETYTTPTIGDIVRVTVTETDWMIDAKIVPGS